ncbi:unnamed protein product [Zymoseptoria tritici ST99CH_3D1]|nr:unnamed protein product [Zymoseptoria tritici ST99CH_3D1]
MNTTTNDKPTGRRALAEIHFNEILSSEQGTSSEDESPGSRDISGGDVRTAIGVSLGNEQNRLNDPRTPAAEKAAVIEREGGFFGPIFDGSADAHSPIEDDEDEDISPSSAERARQQKVAEPGQSLTNASPDRVLQRSRKPSPRRISDSKPTQRSNKTKSILRDGFASFGRKRSWSGPESLSSNRKNSMFANFPSMSMPKGLSMTSPFSSSFDSNKSEGQRTPKQDQSSRRPTLSGMQESNSQAKTIERPGTSRYRRDLSSSPVDNDEAFATVGDLPGTQIQRIKSRPQQLRRSTSDNSLVTMRTLSRVSSLGDDSRFEHVQEQVNSRLKAIKDSYKDSKINLPSMPSISSFSVSSFTPDFLTRDRSDSLPPKPRTRSPSVGLAHREKHAEAPVDPMTRQNYHSAKEAISDTMDKSMIDHPHFSRALEHLEGDVVVLGGYRGSILRSTETGRQVWIPVKVGLNIRKVNLELSLDEDGDERARETIYPDGMLSHIGPVDISRRLIKRLKTCDNAQSWKLRTHNYGYDWRLHPTYLSKQLIEFLEGLPCNQRGVAEKDRGATVIAHSLGGLITRHAVNQRPELFKAVIYAGVPTTCVNILGPLRNGDEVLMSSRVLTAQVNFTIRTSFALLPLDGKCFFDKNTKEEYPVDFFDTQTWIENRLSPCVGRPLPPLSAPSKPTGISGYVSSIANVLPNFTKPAKKSMSQSSNSKTTNIAGVAEPDSLNAGAQGSSVAAAHGNIAHEPGELNEDGEEYEQPSVRTAVTLPRDECIAYLTRTLATIKKFKQELAFNPAHHEANRYPPAAVIYGKSTPTVFGAKIDGREGMKHADSYDELAFASGDGVVLARAAMLPEGYRVVKGGVVSSERGHVTLLGDLEAVGKCLYAVTNARKRGVGMGK